MKLGFVSAIVPDLNLEQVFDLAHHTGYDSVELMCWPLGRAERRYAGVTHVDVSDLTPARADDINGLAASKTVAISGLGYYPNLLAPSEEERKHAEHHLIAVIKGAKMLGLDTVSTFIGRDRTRSIEDNWPQFMAIWPDLIRVAEDHSINIAIENCPMYFTSDEWPGGKNLGSSPALWDRMFEAIPSDRFGLNYDPSHLVWQGMNYVLPLKSYTNKIFRIHFKDAKVDEERMNKVGRLAHPLEYHSPVLPGHGDIDWSKFILALNEIGYNGFASVEVEDRRYEGDLDRRKLALSESAAFLRPLLRNSLNNIARSDIKSRQL